MLLLRLYLYYDQACHGTKPLTSTFMKQLLSITLVVYIAIVGLCIGARRVGQIALSPDFVPGLAICDGVPCYLSITLNTTSWQQAKDILTNTPGFILSSENKGAQAPSGAVRKIITFSNDDKIFEIDLFLQEGSVPFYSLITELGIPCGIHPSNPSLLAISFRDRLAFVKAQNFSIQPDSPVVEIDLGPYSSPARFTPQQQAKRCRRAGDGTQPPKYTWRGFRQYP
jgi:hypothetical protein